LLFALILIEIPLFLQSCKMGLTGIDSLYEYAGKHAEPCTGAP